MSEAPTKLFNKNFFLLWQGQLVSQLGSHAFNIAVMFWIKHETGSATLMGTLMMAAMLPAIIIAPIGGTIADRYSRRKIIIIGDTVNGVVVLFLAGILFLFQDSINPVLVLLYFVSATVAGVGSFFRPAMAAAIPDIVPKEKVAAANSLNQSSMQISMFIGQGLGGVLFRLLGAPALFLIDGLTYLFSALSEPFITIPQEIPERTSRWKEKFSEFKKDTLEGLHYVWKRRGMRDLFIAAAFINFFGMPFIVLMPFYVEDFLKALPDWYGYLLAAFGAGSLLGYLAAGAVRFPAKSKSKLLIICPVCSGIGFGALGIITVPVVALIVIFITGVLNGFFNINVVTILQISTPGEIRGRIFGLMNTLAMGLTPISMGLSGVVADLTGQNIPAIYVVCGLVVVLLVIVLSMSREFREFLAFEQKDEEPQ
ncbi:MAG: MFS transporter [bacterium]